MTIKQLLNNVSLEDLEKLTTEQLQEYCKPYITPVLEAKKEHVVAEGKAITKSRKKPKKDYEQEALRLLAQAQLLQGALSPQTK